MSRQQNQLRDSTSQPRSNRSRPRPSTPGRSQSLGSARRMVEIRSIPLSHSPREEPFLLADDPTSASASRGEALGDRVRPSNSGLRNTISHARHSTGVSLTSELSDSTTNDLGVPSARSVDLTQSPALVLTPRRNQRSFARPTAPSSLLTITSSCFFANQFLPPLCSSLPSFSCETP